MTDLLFVSGFLVDFLFIQKVQSNLYFPFKYKAKGK